MKNFTMAEVTDDTWKRLAAILKKEIPELNGEDNGPTDEDLIMLVKIIMLTPQAFRLAVSQQIVTG